MDTECKEERAEFQALDSRRVVADFDGGEITSDGGAILLRELEEQNQVLERFAACFEDHREQLLIEHPLKDLLAQRVFGLVMGYKDLLDHEELRSDSLFATVCGKKEPTGENRKRDADKHAALAGKSTLNRLELGAVRGGEEQRYCRIECDFDQVDELLLELSLDRYEERPEKVVLDIDPTNFDVHGHQEGRAYHGYYDAYCYLPLYIFAKMFPVCVQLRQGDSGASQGALAKLNWLIKRIRSRWPGIPIWLRGDSDFSRDEMMNWCEDNEVEYVFGFGKNSRLNKKLEPASKQAREAFEQANGTDSPDRVRVFEDFDYRTRKSWSRSRRVVGKAEYNSQGANPRFVVTSMARGEIEAQVLYEEIYCARGNEAERAIGEQLQLFPDCASTHWMASNQLRAYLSTIAAWFGMALREAFESTKFETAETKTLREKILKIGALIKVTVRRVWIHLSSSYPHQDAFRSAVIRIRNRGAPNSELN